MIRQLGRFASVGVAATLVHVSAAIAASLIGLSPHSANGVGFAAALLLSYFGHAHYTFGADVQHRRHGPRFLASAGIGLTLSAAITQIVSVWLGAPIAIAMGVVALAVPVASFLLYKLWVFAPPQPGGP
jgi:putative flippase GtrA